MGDTWRRRGSLITYGAMEGRARGWGYPGYRGVLRPAGRYLHTLNRPLRSRPARYLHTLNPGTLLYLVPKIPKSRARAGGVDLAGASRLTAGGQRFASKGLAARAPQTAAERMASAAKLSKAINLASAAALAGLLPSTAHAQANGNTFDRGESPRLLLKSALWPAQRYCAGGRAFQCRENVLRPRYSPASGRHHAS